MENENWNNLGQQFKDVVQDALKSGDFKNLNNLVADTANIALSQASKQMQRAAGQIDWNFTGQKKPHDTFHYRKSPNPNPVNNWSKPLKPQKLPKNKNNSRGIIPNTQAIIPNLPRKSIVPQSYQPVVRTKNVGQVASILYMVFGGIGTGFAAVGSLIVFIVMICGFSVPGFLWGGLLVFLFSFILMIQRGVSKRGLLKRMQHYLSLCAGKMYINIEELALKANRSRRFVLKDIRKMIRKGFFLEGHLDKQETCLMLDHNTYNQYLQLEKERKMLEIEDKNAKFSADKILGAANEKKQGNNINTEASKKDMAKEISEEELTVNQELNEMIQEGHEYIYKLRAKNDVIEGEVISEKLNQLENLLKEIFYRVKEHPEQMGQMHKLMDYYLPTTLKLVEAYAEFDEVSVKNEDIINAKAEIEKTLDIINEAFAELLNKLFRDTVFDVTTDAQVLQTMLAKEGLTKEM